MIRIFFFFFFRFLFWIIDKEHNQNMRTVERENPVEFGEWYELEWKQKYEKKETLFEELIKFHALGVGKL